MNAEQRTPDAEVELLLTAAVLHQGGAVIAPLRARRAVAILVVVRARLEVEAVAVPPGAAGLLAAGGFRWRSAAAPSPAHRLNSRCSGQTEPAQ